jgi:hypothetical protein
VASGPDAAPGEERDAAREALELAPEEPRIDDPDVAALTSAERAT